MRLDVRVVRSGINTFHWDQKLLILRKPAVYNPLAPRSYEYIQVKVDGRRVIAVRRGADVHVFTTQGIDISNQVAHTEWYAKLWERLPENEWVDGEIYLGGLGREAVSTALASGHHVSFGVFGTSMLSWNASPAAVKLAMTGLGLAEEMLGTMPWMPPEAALAAVRELGIHFDGIIFKNGQYGGWAKFKFNKTIDLVVTAIEAGKGKYAGQTGSLEGSVIQNITQSANRYRAVANVSGMTDEQRREISLHDIGRVFEVEYERVGSGGRLQHPRFVAWRDDKKPCDCGPDQDPALMKVYGNETLQAEE